MEDHPLIEYLFKGEGESIEFKQKLNDEYKIAKTLCALANTHGGIILIGIKDDKTIVGIDPEEEKHVLEKAADFLCKPPVPLSLEELYWDDQGNEKIILKVEISPSEEKPHYAQNKAGEWIAYLRHKDKTLLAGPRAIVSMKTNPSSFESNFSLSKNETRLLIYLNEYERITLKIYMELVNISSRRARRELQDALEKGIIRTLQHEKEDYFVI